MTSMSEFMENDHDRLGGILKDFENKRNNHEEAKALFFSFKTGLQRHIVWEEEILFPLFEKKMGIQPSGMHANTPTSVLRMEHMQIKEFLDKIHEELASNKDAGELEKWLAQLLSSHNDKEENVLYPWLDEVMDENERNDTFAKMNALPPEKYDDCRNHNKGF